MTYKVGPKGQVVLPKELRDRYGIRPGDEVVFEGGDGEIRVRRARSGSALLGMLADVPGVGTEALERERRLDRELEERKMKRMFR
jgi:AbrB family looped-hinge helix DNA binding protein